MLSARDAAVETVPTSRSAIFVRDKRCGGSLRVSHISGLRAFVAALVSCINRARPGYHKISDERRHEKMLPKRLDNRVFLLYNESAPIDDWRFERYRESVHFLSEFFGSAPTRRR